MVLDLVWYFLIYHFLVAKQFVHIFDFVISPHVAALLIVFPITFLTGFWLNRYVVFQVWQYNGLKQVFKYALTVVGSLILNYVCIKFFVEVCAIWPTPAKALTTLVCVAYSYLLGRYFTFTVR
jgi:putative flippase GtrA